ncbi:hypothetical protein AJ80_09947 [Polytolypa hystricis UAMH7299]|uniref:Uncharacterized protein n=1 Tax=Polytolypa hystricis (strain UAMH7299) TaxID=1447883 RepID=A0A2B7WG61_POLH7|nr:hypothetical protein AJ80_09947 [Polytolypa hystricis UAMH7299]
MANQQPQPPMANIPAPVQIANPQPQVQQFVVHTTTVDISLLRTLFAREVNNMQRIIELEQLVKTVGLANQDERMTRNRLEDQNEELQRKLNEQTAIRQMLSKAFDDLREFKQAEQAQFQETISLMEKEINDYKNMISLLEQEEWKNESVA